VRTVCIRGFLGKIGFIYRIANKVEISAGWDEKGAISGENQCYQGKFWSQGE
jgi:hypothetical protein